MFTEANFQTKVAWSTLPARRTVQRINIASIDPRGGGLITLLADLAVLTVCFAATIRLLESEPIRLLEEERLLQVGFILILWALLGTWRTPHAVFQNNGFLRGSLHIGWHFLQTLALSCMALSVCPAPRPMDGILLAALLFSGFGGLLIVRYVELKIVDWVKASTQHHLRILLVGNNERTRQILEYLRLNPQDRIKVIGLLDPEPHNPARAVDTEDVSYMGNIDKLPGLLYGGLVDEVVITLPVRSRYQETEKVLKACSEAGIRTHVLSDIFDIGEPRREISGLGSNQTLAYARGPAPTYRLAIKRNIDFVVSLLGILCLSPVLAAIALAVKLTSPSPILFCQTRSGLNGRPFQLLKFRTMCVEAEDKKKALLEKNEASGPVFKIQYDPRITRIGRFLRKYSLDELPQLFNIFKGEMSLVGPRPPIPEEVKDYNFWQLRRLSMRPGLTCFWQVSGRNKIGFEEWMRMDLRYIDNWSLTLDFLVLLRTIPTVLRGTGM